MKHSTITNSIWNFRDANTHNPIIKEGFLFRSSSFSLIPNKESINDLLKEKNITTIIDLRADRELLANPYSGTILTNIKYIHAPFDPWNQPDWFQKNHQIGTNEEIAYRFFTMCCKRSVKQVVETILEQKSGNIAIHCHAGKDRTGIIFALFHLLINSSLENIYVDYLASEMDTTMDKIAITLDIIDDEGGIESYLHSCGLTENKLTKLKHKLLDE
ncbi:hypothetical protein IMCC3317_06430 [Kordia antarctica]|uniref:Tyrosine specific protein phosphatases domain-containing protein n=1 Tax=Kordia antarctica TaxID=1218801 RepID=A0A7L4ZFP5_9FLAO|nr:tyrosine-protein phosphatase [Kordia antarctica]QHI35297.1 hypothetical protein IMCC3317_06430 [Kordia antarctica]